MCVALRFLSDLSRRVHILSEISSAQAPKGKRAAHDFQEMSLAFRNDVRKVASMRPLH